MVDAAAQSKPSSSVKLVLLGEAAVGKSSLVMRFVSNEFQENKEPTIGAAFLTQKCALPNRTIKFEIWDTAGQERFASLAPMYYRNAQAAIVVYDITKSSSLIKAQHWVAELHRQASPGIVIALVGNKYDLANTGGGGQDGSEDTDTLPFNDSRSNQAREEGGEEDEGQVEEQQEQEEEANMGARRHVSTKTAKGYADEEGLLFFEVSAKTGQNVAQVFTAIANAIPETSLKVMRGGAAVSGQTQLGRHEDARVNLGNAHMEGAQEGCAC